MQRRNHNRNQANNGGKWIRPEKRRAIYKRDDYRCLYCQAWLELRPDELTLDHLVPSEMGGTNEARNLVTSCKSCNSSKCAKSIRQFFSSLRRRGVNTEAISKRIRCHTRRSLKNYKERI